jgi:hypothetical protein
MICDKLSIKYKQGKEIIFFDNSYGDLGVMIRGPRRGILADILISDDDVRTLKKFLEMWSDTRQK